MSRYIQLLTPIPPPCFLPFNALGVLLDGHVDVECKTVHHPSPSASPPSSQFPSRQQLCKRCSLHLVYRPVIVYREFRTYVRLQCALSSSLNRHSTRGTGTYLTGYLPVVIARHIHVSTPAAPSSSWQLLAVPVSSWQLPAAPGSSWQPLAATKLIFCMIFGPGGRKIVITRRSGQLQSSYFACADLWTC